MSYGGFMRKWTVASKRNRLVLWLAVGTVAVFGGFAFVAFRQPPLDREQRYDTAVEILKSKYVGPYVFDVSPLVDPRTRIETTAHGFFLHGVLRTDHPELAKYTKASATGEIKFMISVREEFRFDRRVMDTTMNGLHFEPVE